MTRAFFILFIMVTACDVYDPEQAYADGVEDGCAETRNELYDLGLSDGASCVDDEPRVSCHGPDDAEYGVGWAEGCQECGMGEYERGVTDGEYNRLQAGEGECP